MGKRKPSPREMATRDRIDALQLKFERDYVRLARIFNRMQKTRRQLAGAKHSLAKLLSLAVSGAETDGHGKIGG